MNSFYNCDELKSIGFNSVGKNVLISKKASIYGAENIRIGNNVRVDDFCVLSGKIIIADYVHIAAYSGLWGGKEGIWLEDYVNISSRNTIYAVSDDFSGETMTSPMIPSAYKNVTEKKVVLRKHVIIGSGCCILPGVTLNEGVAVGSMSLVNKELPEWGIYAGIPCRFLKDRKRELLRFEEEFKSNN